MKYDHRVTLMLVIIFSLLIVIVGMERAALATHQLKRANQAALHQ